MIEEIIKRASQITSSEDGWVGLRDYNKNKSQKAFLADELIKSTQTGDLKWVISRSNNLAVCSKGCWMLAIVREGNNNFSSRYIDGTVDCYVLTVFKEGSEIMSFKDSCDNACYDSNSRRLPVMDLYDIITNGKFRKPHTAHVCGLQGFGWSTFDSCPACEERQK